MLEAMWAANALDIQQTLRAVCRAVLLEPGVDKAVLRARAAALKEAGQIFREARAAVAPPALGGGGAAGEAARRQMEDAMMRVIEKRTGEDLQQHEHEAAAAATAAAAYTSAP